MKEEKFHEALLKLLYPPPPSPPPQEEDEDDQSRGLLDPPYHLPGVEEGMTHSSSSSSDGDAAGDGKLTRAQRKRIRKKKMKEAASRRRKMIGPLLRGDEGTHGGGENRGSKNAETPSTTGEPKFCSDQKKIKRRRLSKKMPSST